VSVPANIDGPVRSTWGLDYYIRRGSGPTAAPIVALHPWFGCWQFWLPVVATFPERDWILVDLYSGAHRIPADHTAFDGLAAAVSGLLDEVADGPVVLAGNSTGGLLAQAIAIAGRPRLDALVLVGTGASAAGVKAEFRATLGSWLDAAGAPEPALTHSVVRSLLARDPDPDTFREYTEAVTSADYPFLSAVLRGVLGQDLTDQLPRVAVPTLVIRGARDAARTEEHVRVLCAGIPDCASIEIAMAGHSPMVDQPEAFDRALREFLTRVASK
jgi:3-oxoadipate enol-lactonase